MQSKVSFCNRAVLRKNLTRFTPLWALYLALWIIILPLSLYSNYMSYGGSAVGVQGTILTIALYGGSFINLAYAIITVMALFAFMYSPRSINTIAALPVRRETLFSTNVCTGLLVSVVPNIIVALLTWLVGGVTGYALLPTILQWLAMVTLQYLFFFGLACISACFVGHLLALPILYGLLNFSAIVLNYLVLQILSTFVYGLSTSGGMFNGLALMPLSPMVELLSKGYIYSNTALQNGMEVTLSPSFGGWGYLGILAGVGVALLVVGFFLFRKRHMETAGDVIAIRRLRPVFKYGFTIGCSIVLGMLAAATIFSGSNRPSVVGITACLLFGGFVGYFASEMLVRKTLRVFGRAWIGFGVFGVCLIAAIGMMEFDALGYERRVPDARAVQAVQISQFNYGSQALLTDEAHIIDAITLHQRVIDEKAQQEQYADQQCPAEPLEFLYTLKNGDVISRTYSVSFLLNDWQDKDSLIRQYDAVYNDPYVVELRYSPNNNLTAKNISSTTISGPLPSGEWTNVDLNYDEAYTLYTECILPDIRDGNLGKATFVGDSPSLQMAQSTKTYASSITINFERTQKGPDGRELHNSSYIDISITEAATRTVAFLKDLGIELISQSDYDSGLYLD